MNSAETLDGGWGWIVVLASFIVHFIADGIIYTYGVFVPSLVDYFDAGHAVVGGIGSLTVSIMWVAGPLASVVVSRFGYRAATIVGSLMAACGLIGSALSPNLLLIYISYGILSGLGLSFVYLPSIVIISHYFDRRRALATGISFCGVGFGTMLVGPFAGYLLSVYGWRGTLLIEGSLLFNCCACGMIFVLPHAANTRVKSSVNGPLRSDGVDDDVAVECDAKSSEPDLGCQHVLNKSCLENGAADNDSDGRNICELSLSSECARNNNQQSSTDNMAVMYCEQSTAENIEENLGNDSLLAADPQTGKARESTKPKCFDFALLKDATLIICALSNLLASLGLAASFIFLPDLSQLQAGLSSHQISALFLVLGITNTVMRAVIGAIADLPCVNVVFTYGMTVIVLGIASLFVPLYDNFILFVGYSAVFGISLGSNTCLLPIVLANLFGIDRLNDSFGVVLFCCGIGVAAGAPIVGALYDYQQNYNHSYIFAGSVLIISGLMVFLLPCVRRHSTTHTVSA